MTSSVDIFSAVNRKGGGLGGGGTDAQGSSELCRRRKNAPDTETSAILLVASQGSSGCVGVVGEENGGHSLMWLLVLNSTVWTFKRTQDSLFFLMWHSEQPELVRNNVRTWHHTCKLVEVGWDTLECIYNIHILEKNYTRGYNCSQGGAMLSGVDVTLAPTWVRTYFSVYIKLLDCSNTDRRCRWSKRRLQMCSFLPGHQP